MTQHIDLDALQAAAKAATPGDGQHMYTHPRDDNNWNANEDFHRACSPAVVSALIARLKKAEAANQWMPIETAPKGRSIVVGYFNRYGKWRTVKAEYATEEIIAEWENDDCEPGWYESSEEQEIIYRLEYEPSYWHPLTAAPSDSVEGAKG